MNSAKTATKVKTKPKLEEEMRKDNPDWIGGSEAARRVGMSRPLLYDIIKSGRIKTFLFKRTPQAQAGIRLIHWPSLQKYMEERYQEATRSGVKVWVPVRRKGSGRSIKQEVRAP